MTKKKKELERLRALCMSLPEVVEKPFGGHIDPSWRVRDKIFADYRDNEYHGGRPTLHCKGAPGAQAALVGGQPDQFYVPPYSGHNGWIGVRLDRAVDWDLVEDLVRESYRLIAPKRLAAQM